MPNPELASYYPRGVNSYVPNMQYHSDVGTDHVGRARIGSGTGGPPPAANATGYFNAVSVASAQTGYNTYSAAYTSNLQLVGTATYGRGVQLVASGAYAGVITVHGRDYLGQPMSEALTSNGTTPVLGKKAFAWVDSFDAPTVGAGVTVNIGWTDLLGLPFCSRSLIQETVNFVTTANPGTFTGAITTAQTLTAGDPKGTHLLNAANATNGVNTYQYLLQVDRNNIHGVAHSYT